MRLFLVEDEVMALQSLQRKIEDLDGDWEIAGTASGGTEALEKIPAAAPHMVLTDIRMPDMDGITLIERLREQKIRASCIIISGYQEFEYAKQAMRLGVQDYLLKPVDPAELDRSLQRCRDTILLRRSQENAGAFPNIPFRPGEAYYAAYIIVGNALSGQAHSHHPQIPYFSGIQAEKIIAPSLENVQIYSVDGFYSNEAALLLHGKDLSSEIQSRLESAAGALLSRTNQYITIFYRKVEDPGHLESAIRACRRGAQKRMLFGENVVTCHTHHPDAPDRKLGDRAKLLILLLRQNQTRDLQRQVDKMLQEWRAAKRSAADITADLVFLLDSVKHALPDRQNFDFDSVFFIENLICFADGWDGLSRDFCTLLWECFQAEPEDRTLSGEELVAQIENYFQANVSENITLQDLADEMGFSKVYMCRVFKKLKNTTPIDYFTHLKIQRAQQMIQSFPSMPLREISEALGFSDMYYFSKVFKRLTGVSPSELRNKKSD